MIQLSSASLWKTKFITLNSTFANGLSCVSSCFVFVDWRCAKSPLTMHTVQRTCPLLAAVWYYIEGTNKFNTILSNRSRNITPVLTLNGSVRHISWFPTAYENENWCLCVCGSPGLAAVSAPSQTRPRCPSQCSTDTLTPWERESGALRSNLSRRGTTRCRETSS